MPDSPDTSANSPGEKATLPPVMAFTARVWVERVVVGTAATEEEIGERVAVLLAEELDQSKYVMVRLGLTTAETVWS